MDPLTALIASSSNDTGGWGLLIIAAVVVAIVIAVGAVWTLVGRRAGRTPQRVPHDHEPGARGDG
jgi:hypothetical protein